MFALNLMAMVSEVGWFHPSMLGWIVIAIAWTIIGALWLAGSFLTVQRASQSSGLAPERKATELRRKQVSR